MKGVSYSNFWYSNSIPPRNLNHAKVCLDISNLSKKNTPASVFLRNLMESRTNINFALQFMLVGQKSMTWLDVQQL